MGFCYISKGIGRLFRICRRLPCRWLARGEGESSKHHKSDSPELHCFHIALIVIKVFLFIIVFIIISVWQRYGKGTKIPSAKPIIWLPRVWVLTQVKSLSFIMGLRGVFTQKKLPNYLALLKDYRKFANENSVFTQKK